jgi:type VI secretion system Hcp family effector
MSFHSYASFKGVRQGTFKGEATVAERRDKWTELVDFKMGSETPFDANTGRPKGARTHQPVIITKEKGVASPLLLNAHWTSEVLDEVVVEVVGRPSSGAGETVVQRITLTNATITNYRQYLVALGKPHSAKGSAGSGGLGRFLTDFVFDYERIEFRPY